MWIQDIRNLHRCWVMAILALALLAPGLSGMVLCSSADGHLAVEAAHTGHAGDCGDHDADHSHEHSPTHDDDCESDCVDVAIVTDALRPGPRATDGLPSTSSDLIPATLAHATSSGRLPLTWVRRSVSDSPPLPLDRLAEQYNVILRV